MPSLRSSPVVIHRILLVAVCLSALAFAPRLAAQREATSLLGRPLERPTLEAETRAALETNLAAARAAYQANPEDEESIIWYGRRLAYLSRYQDAIAIFTKGLELHPESAKLLRHRGHRYITLREFERAIADLSRAADLVANRDDEIEPDGAPNAAGIPRSTLKTNIYYHLGLARYLTGAFDAAALEFARCANASTNDDMLVAALNWWILSLKRAEREDEMTTALAWLPKEPKLLENEDYDALIRAYQQRIEPAKFLEGIEPGTVAFATRGYGAAAFALTSSLNTMAIRTMESIIEHSPWASFGHIAAEADLARLRALKNRPESNDAPEAEGRL